MVRVGGLSYHIEPGARAGERISMLRLMERDIPIEEGKSYTVAGWASVNEGGDGKPIWEVVKAYLNGSSQTIAVRPESRVTLR